MEKLIYDVDGTNGSRYGGNCPKFVLNEQTGMVSLVDRQGNRSNMNVSEFNQIARAFKSGEISEIKTVLRK